MSSHVSKFSRTDNYQSQSSFKNYPNCDKPTFQSLPKDLLGQIFLHLNSRDLQSAVRLNRKMQIAVLDTARTNVPDLMKSFIKSLREKLGADSPLGKQLPEIPKSITDPNCKNLPLFKNYILGVKQELAQVIKLLDVEAEGRLKAQTQLPEFMEDLFKLSAQEREITAVLALPQSFQNGGAFEKIFKTLIATGNVERAIKVAKDIPDEGESGLAFYCLSKVLIEAKEITRALELREMTSSPWAKVEIAYKVVIGFLNSRKKDKGNMDKAYSLAWSIPDKTTQGRALQSFSEALLEDNRLQEACSIAMQIPYECAKNVALKEVARAFLKTGKIEEAIAAVKVMPRESGEMASSAEWISMEIVRAIAKKGMDRDAVEVMGMLNVFSFKGLREIVEVLAQTENIDGAFRVATSITEALEKSKAFKNVAYALARVKKFEDAIYIAKTISCSSEKNMALQHISRALKEDGKMDKAREVAEMISAKKMKEMAFKRINES